jgi:Mn-dependent DtxR family transcriptional regulator
MYGSQDRIDMSQRERDVLKIMAAVLRGERTQAEAARLLGKSVRQVRRMQRRLEKEGDRGVVHRLRGRSSNHQVGAELRHKVIGEYRRRLVGFGPTLASEKLGEWSLAVSRETLRHWLLAENLWTRQRCIVAGGRGARALAN